MTWIDSDDELESDRIEPIRSNETETRTKMAWHGFPSMAHADGPHAGLFDECSIDSMKEYVCVDGGETVSLGIDACGRLYGWGTAFYGEFGPSSEEDDREAARSFPREIAMPRACVKISCGSNHVLALSNAGSVFAWGWNRFGQAGQDPSINQVVHEPKEVTSLISGMRSSFSDVAAGGTHSLALDTQGRVWSWGNNTHGQLGLGSDLSTHTTPTCISLTSKTAVRAIAAGWAHSALITREVQEGVYTFGWGLYHQLGHGETRNEQLPHRLEALDGLDGGIQAIACGMWHTAAITTSGDVYTWGWGPNGQLGPSHAANEAYPRVVDTDDGYFEAEDRGHGAVQVVCGVRHTVVLARNGDVHWWGQSPWKSSTRRQIEEAGIDMNARVQSIVSGNSHVLLQVVRALS